MCRINDRNKAEVEKALLKKNEKENLESFFLGDSKSTLFIFYFFSGGVRQSLVPEGVSIMIY